MSSSSSVAGKVWGIVVVQDRSSHNEVTTSETTSNVKYLSRYLFLQEKSDQPYTIPCYDITAVNNVKSHLESKFVKVNSLYIKYKKLDRIHVVVNILC